MCSLPKQFCCLCTGRKEREREGGREGERKGGRG